jgi:hypothetical protein
LGLALLDQDIDLSQGLWGFAEFGMMNFQELMAAARLMW